MGFGGGSKSKRNKNELGDDEEMVVVPPDGGWGWIVVLGSFLIHVIADGISYSFGVVIKELLVEFKEGKGPTSWIVSILIGVTLATGPIASAITNRFGCRSTTMVGGVIATAGSFLSYFGGSVLFLIITMGVITGLGFGLMYCPAIIIVTVYFEKRRALATGIAVAGAGVGTLIFPPLTAYLMEQYTWRGTFFIYSGIILNCVVCGALFRAPPTQRVSKLKNGVDKAKNGGVHMEIDGSHAHIGGQILDAIAEEEELDTKGQVTVSAPETRIGSPKQLNDDRFKYTPEIVDDVPLAATARTAMVNRQTSVPDHESASAAAARAADGDRERFFSSEMVNGAPIRSVSSATTNAPVLQRGQSECHHFGSGASVLNRKDIFYPGSVTNLPEYKSNPQLYRSQISLHRPPSVTHDGAAPDYYHELSATSQISVEAGASSATAPISGLKKNWADIKSTIKGMMDLHIMLNPLFVIFTMSTFLTCVGMTPPLVFLPDRAAHMGMENEDFLLSIFGIANTLGRLAIGWASDQRWANRLLIYNVSLSIAGLGTILSFLCKTFGWLSVYSAFYGVAMSASVSLQSVILVDLIGLDMLTNAFGLMLLFQGVASLIGAPIAGTIADNTGSYDGSFVFAGVVIFASGLMLFPLPCFQRWLERRDQRKFGKSSQKQQQTELLLIKT